MPAMLLDLFFLKTVRILVKWYFYELLGYLLMPFTSIRVIAHDKNKLEFIFSDIAMLLLYRYCYQRKNKVILNDSIFKSYDFNEIEC